MGRNLWAAAWLVAGVLLISCGDDDSSDDSPSGMDGGGNDSGPDRDSGNSPGSMDATTGDTDSGASGNSGGSGGTGGASSVDSGMSTDEDGGASESEPCGAVVCEAPECCVDPFVSLCGAKLGRACLMPPPEGEGADPRCPSVNIMGIFMIPSCCTDDGQCGINAMMFGSGCITYEEAEMGAMRMGAPAGLIPWPEPQSCD